ncbi:hypothetical protein [Bacillus weihaiensis]|uniref:hypothetical protein n=1 Tax=Bacillus weihaiensis TaxID=1547283 RepID=UPI0023522DD2|nr:hypothetical protein [Bacillus weihaiensis]
MNNEWLKVIEQFEKEGLTPKEVNKMVRGYQMVKMVMETVEDLNENKDTINEIAEN